MIYKWLKTKSTIGLGLLREDKLERYKKITFAASIILLIGVSLFNQFYFKNYNNQ